MLVEPLLEAAAECPDRPAVVDPTRTMTYRDLARLAAVVSRIVRKYTSRAQVGIMLPASAACPAVLHGVLWAGRTAVPLNFLSSAEELAPVVEDADLDCILTVKPLAELADALPARAIYLEDLPLKWHMLLAMVRRMPAAPRVKQDDVAVLLYTSGTTGRPKGVELTYGNLTSNCIDTIASAGIRPGTSFLNILPPFHVFGLTGNVLIPIRLRSTVYAIPRFNPAAVVRTLREHEIGVMLAIPSMYAALLRAKSAKRSYFESIEFAISGGEPLSERVRTALSEQFGVHLREGYGLTETSPVLAVDGGDETSPGTVGRPIERVELSLRDAEGKQVEPGEDGEIFARGPGVMKGYRNMPKETSAVLDAEGWFRTGDIGRIDEQGRLSITGRAKEMLIIGGENVFPREIESVIEEIPGVLQVAVIGTPDEMRGEVAVAFVLPDEGADINEGAIRAHCKSKLASLKVPRAVHVREDLPLGPTGKIQKRKLRELIAAE